MNYDELHMAYRRSSYDKTPTFDEILAMIKNEDPALQNDNGDTLLHLASENLHLEAMQYLLEKGLDPNAQDSRGRTPLWSIAMLRPLSDKFPENTIYDAAKLLMENGASTMRKDDEGRWCYLVAASNCNGEFIKALQDCGGVIKKTDEGGNNGMHLLIESLYNPLNDVRLAQKRFDDSYDNNREATERNLIDAKEKAKYCVDLAALGVRAFLDAGVDPEDKNSMGETSFVLAERRNATKINAILKGEISGLEPDDDNEAQAKIVTGGLTLHKAIAAKNMEAVLKLIEQGEDVNQVSDIYEYGEGTPLAMACFNCDYEMVEVLLGAGADPSLRSGNGTIAMSWLMMPRNLNDLNKAFNEKWPAKILSAMCGKGLDINTTMNDSEDTILTFACRNEAWEVFVTRETVRWIIINEALRLGADVNGSNIQGQNALMLTCLGTDHNFKMAVDLQLLLLENGADVGLRDAGGNTALHYTAYNTDLMRAVEMAENLFDFADPDANVVNNDQKTAMDYAVANDNEALVKYLLTKM